MKMKGLTAFVTGATGFVGGRLIESLVSDHSVKVRALVRGTEVGPGTFRAARNLVDFVQYDINNVEALTETMKGCDLVFHCAFGSRGTLAEQRKVTVGGTRALIEAAESTGSVQRFINLSSATVFGAPVGSSIDESSPANPSRNWHYACDKWEAEKIVASSTIDTTTLRLSSVYGPGSPAFALMPINELKSGRVALINGGSGELNPLYVDDAVQAILLAATSKNAAGKTFLLNGPDQVTRRELYERYAKMLKLEGRTVDMSASEVRRTLRRQKRASTLALPKSALKALKGDYSFKANLRHSYFASLAEKIVRSKQGAPTALPTRENLPTIFPPEFMIDYLASTTRFDSSKSQSLLGYSPQFSFDEGMKMTEEWAKWARLFD